MKSESFSKIRPSFWMRYGMIACGLFYIAFAFIYFNEAFKSWRPHLSLMAMALNPVLLWNSGSSQRLEIRGDRLQLGKSAIARDQVYQVDFSNKGAVIFERSGKIHELIRKRYRSDDWPKVDEVLRSWGV